MKPGLTSVRVIVYDCDGVLVDSRESNEAFYNHILARFGLPPLEPEQLEFICVSTAVAAIDYLFRDSPLLREAQFYQSQIDNTPFIPLIRLEPNIWETLARLRPAYRTAVATNRGKSLPLVLQHHRLAGLFDLTVTSLEVAEPKPHPECLQRILRHFQAAPEEIVYIGDAEVDRLVSERAGAPFIAYKNPLLNARHCLQDHLDLLEILGLES
jgi:phosphoglycolate phosphatase-like HAD superfamily hydrolase